jgi:hypothetical protein
MQGALLVDGEGKILNRMSGNEFGHRVGDDLGSFAALYVRS